MTSTLAITPRPQRWDEPFGQPLTAAELDELLGHPLLSGIDPAAFPPRVPLRGILQNDARIVDFDPGDLILREGDYGSSAFLILNGQVGVALKSVPSQLLGRPNARRRNWTQRIAGWWGRAQIPEVRSAMRQPGAASSDLAARTGRDGRLRVFLQDIPRILAPDEIETMGPGELFGEMAALTRSPRSATVFAHSPCQLLEIRWQGLRDLMKYSPGLRHYTDQQYRQHSLQVHLRETPLLHGLDDAVVRAIAAGVQFQAFGNFEWQQRFRSLASQELRQRIESEPLIAQEGDFVSGLYLLRSGFVRVSRQHGAGHQTLTYLGKGDYFGFSEILHQLLHSVTLPWQHSFRAIGYVDVLLIPNLLVQQYILPNWPSPEAAADRLHSTLGPPRRPAGLVGGEDAAATFAANGLQFHEPWAGNVTRQGSAAPDHQDRLEQFVQLRLINGEQAMLIDLDRCTRCDDCLRACADAHDGNPRFLRQGPVIGHHMVAQACMHCTDPVCLIGCPTGAIGREPSSGVVRINDPTCIGCGTCAQSCPYENIRMVEIFDREFRQRVDEQQRPLLKATKCDLCVESTGPPACQNACPHDALVRINLRETDVLSQWLDR